MVADTAWARAGPSVLAAFLASMVEFVEALTGVMAVGSVRGWRDALLGSAAAIAVLLTLVVVLGSALTRVPLAVIQIVVGALLLLFGLRWLRKAILRSAGVIPLHDEQVAFVKHTEVMRHQGAHGSGWD
jgi:Ca2+/H+ antiporter, TMEM165/GDT1 family